LKGGKSLVKFYALPRRRGKLLEIFLTLKGGKSLVKFYALPRRRGKSLEIFHASSEESKTSRKNFILCPNREEKL
jgi:hypothetical protein